MAFLKLRTAGLKSGLCRTVTKILIKWSQIHNERKSVADPGEQMRG